VDTWAVGVDLGGTNIRAAEIDPAGTVGAFVSEPVDWHSPSTRPFGQLVGVVAQILSTRQEPPIGIGLGVTGPVDPMTGIIDNPFTLPASLQGDARQPLVDAFSVPVMLENDANVAAVAEMRFGAARGRSVVICITVGTGVGVGVVRDGILHRGAGSAHPEAGHLSVDPAGPQCYCGANGCIESLASGEAVREAGVAAGVMAADGSAKDVHDAADRGDPVATNIVERARRALGLGARNLVAAHSADTVVLAGNALGDKRLMLDAVRSSIEGFPFVPTGGVLVVESQLGGHAGCVGAAALVLGP